MIKYDPMYAGFITPKRVLKRAGIHQR
ncbi:MAG: hypothetical protein K0S68_970, partial [Candidatus Saccharibacteria bacterium]|nr:hypothetical protein [Candidatus Saccharibacteria bacterium]